MVDTAEDLPAGSGPPLSIGGRIIDACCWSGARGIGRVARCGERGGRGGRRDDWVPVVIHLPTRASLSGLEVRLYPNVRVSGGGDGPLLVRRMLTGKGSPNAGAGGPGYPPALLGELPVVLLGPYSGNEYMPVQE